MAEEYFAGGIDVRGTTALANAQAMMRYGSTYALADGVDLPASVPPIILRAPEDVRAASW